MVYTRKTLVSSQAKRLFFAKRKAFFSKAFFLWKERLEPSFKKPFFEKNPIQ
jgi:hypothetical protein